MRLPESKIKQAILHPEKMGREKALDYFADCYSRDVEVMPLAIKAIETYGHGKAFQGLYDLTKLAQTEATVEWVIRELHREKDKTEDHESYFSHLSSLLCSADIRLVAPREGEILQAPGFTQGLVPAFQERLQLATWDGDQCWEELDRFCADAIDKQDSSKVAIDHANRVVEALARQGEKHIERILDLLGQDVKDFDTDPMVWMEEFLVRLAGEMRLDRAIPLIVQKLHKCGEVLSEECVEALGKIGTDDAAEAVAEGWMQTEWDYRLYASSALEKIHSDTTVRKCLELLPQDKDVGIRTNLADALLSQFADEGIEPVREMVQRRAYDSMASDLMRSLVAVSTVLGVTFPEYPTWKREVEERWAKQERRMKEMEAFFHASQEPLPSAKAARIEEREPVPERHLTPFLRTDKKVGRNDPCPCGSGKKFKKCCMNRDRE